MYCHGEVGSMRQSTVSGRVNAARPQEGQQDTGHKAQGGRDGDATKWDRNSNFLKFQNSIGREGLS